MEASPLAIALIGVIGGILVCMLGLLITIVLGLKKDVDAKHICLGKKIDDKIKGLTEKIEAIQLRLTHMVLVEDYKGDLKNIDIKLDEHGDRILILEIVVGKKRTTNNE